VELVARAQLAVMPMQERQLLQVAEELAQQRIPAAMVEQHLLVTLPAAVAAAVRVIRVMALLGRLAVLAVW
jgi:hypothetical protein